MQKLQTAHTVWENGCSISINRWSYHMQKLQTAHTVWENGCLINISRWSYYIQCIFHSSYIVLKCLVFVILYVKTAGFAFIWYMMDAHEQQVKEFEKEYRSLIGALKSVSDNF